MHTTGYPDILARMQAAAASAGRSGQVRLVAVSKTFGPSRVLDAIHEGANILGENYVQELLQKKPEIETALRIPVGTLHTHDQMGLEWHFIGHLQSNKVRQILPHVTLIHSVDRESLLEELHRRAIGLERSVPILLEVNLGGETSKSGVTPEALEPLARAALARSGVTLRGVMAIPPPADDAEASRGAFRTLRLLRDRLQERIGQVLPELSMGMSNDFEVAIEEGATLIRVGTAIFGARSRPLMP